MLQSIAGAQPTAPGVIERREFGRREVALPGQILVPLRPALPCRLLNVSRGGALLEVVGADFVPNRFKLQVGNFIADCEIRHRTSRSIGVEFDVPCRFDLVGYQ